MNSALHSGRLLNTQGFDIYISDFDQLSQKYMYQPRYVVIREIYGVCVCANVHIYIPCMYNISIVSTFYAPVH